MNARQHASLNQFRFMGRYVAARSVKDPCRSLTRSENTATLSPASPSTNGVPPPWPARPPPLSRRCCRPSASGEESDVPERIDCVPAAWIPRNPRVHTCRTQLRALRFGRQRIEDGRKVRHQRQHPTGVLEHAGMPHAGKPRIGILAQQRAQSHVGMAGVRRVLQRQACHGNRQRHAINPRRGDALCPSAPSPARPADHASGMASAGRSGAGTFPQWRPARNR